MLDEIATLLSGVAAIISTAIAAKVYYDSRREKPDIRFQEEPWNIPRTSSANSYSDHKAKLSFMNYGTLKGALMDVEGAVPPTSTLGRFSITVDRSKFPIAIDAFTPYTHFAEIGIETNPSKTVADMAKECANSAKCELIYSIGTKKGIEKRKGSLEFRFV